ncbi:MAG: PASTA domain-containing protein, partial [Candidatus Latescibacteria bacterium]|nr:PASTA domain-containing protein [Candidatus Latescibacterota bacterium]
SGGQLDAGTALPPGSAVHYAKMIHPSGYPPPPPPPGPDVSFEVISGQASDIGAGGTIWTIGKHSDLAYRRFMEGWQNKGGGYTRIDTSPTSIWAVNQAGNTRYVLNSVWNDAPTGGILAQDVGHGWGNTWIAGSNPPYDIQRLKFTLPLTWDTPISVPGGAKRIDVDLHGNPWVVNQHGQIYRHLTGGWGLLPGVAKDIGCGEKGEVWVVGTTPVNGGYGIYRWNEDNLNWIQIPDIGGVAISVDGRGGPHVLAEDGTIYKGTLSWNAPSSSPPPASHPPVPSVVGMTTADAVLALENAGYVASRSSTAYTTDTNLFDTIESTSPAGGEPLAPGSTVTYVGLQYGFPSTFETLGPSTLPATFAIEADVTINASASWGRIFEIGYPEHSNQAPLRLQALDEGGWYIAVGDGVNFSDESFRGTWTFGTPFRLRVTYDHESTHTSVYENGERVFTYSPDPVPSGMIGTVVLGHDGAAAHGFNAQVTDFQITEVDFHTDWSDQSHIANDIGVGHENTRWISEGGRVYRSNGPGIWDDMGLDGARNIDVDPQGNAWVVMQDNSIIVWNGSGWQDIQTGGALDIGVGADGSGSVWIIGANPIGSVWLYNPSVEGNWINAQLQDATRVDVATNGQAYVVKGDGTIWHYIGTRDGSHIEWVEVVRSLRAKDIGVGGPSLWAVGQDNSVHRWSAAVNDWQRTNGQAYEISVDQYGNAWAVEAGTRNLVLGIGQ